MRTAEIARARLRQDQVARGLAAQREHLAALSGRLDAGARSALSHHLASRVHKDPRFVPMLRQLMRMALT